MWVLLWYRIKKIMCSCMQFSIKVYLDPKVNNWNKTRIYGRSHEKIFK